MHLQNDTQAYISVVDQGMANLHTIHTVHAKTPELDFVTASVNVRT